MFLSSLNLLSDVLQLDNKLECSSNESVVVNGNWVVLQDLENLDLFRIGRGFRLIECTACAAKLRLLSELGAERFADWMRNSEWHNQITWRDHLELGIASPSFTHCTRTRSSCVQKGFRSTAFAGRGRTNPRSTSRKKHACRSQYA